jgi:hypothetical protein
LVVCWCKKRKQSFVLDVLVLEGLVLKKFGEVEWALSTVQYDIRKIWITYRLSVSTGGTITLSKVINHPKLSDFPVEDITVAGSAETAFHLPKQSTLYVRTQNCELRAREHFCHQVARTPLDFRVHVQRINFEVRRKENQAIYSALLDLYIALGSQGSSIRNRMLEKTRPFLYPEQKSFFETNVQNGVSSEDVAPEAKFSVLTKSVAGRFTFIEKVEEPTQDTQSALELANEHIEFGQIDQAIAVLEQSISAERACIEEQKLLIDVHRHLRQRYVFQKSRKIIIDKKVDMISEWHELYRELLLGALQ